MKLSYAFITRQSCGTPWAVTFCAKKRTKAAIKTLLGEPGVKHMVIGKKERIFACIGYLFSFVFALAYAMADIYYGDEGGGKFFWSSVGIIIAMIITNEYSIRSINRKCAQNIDGSFTTRARKRIASLYISTAYICVVCFIVAISWVVISNA